MKGFTLAWRLLQGQASRAWLFIFCIALGVAARTGVGSFLGSLDQALARESRSLLGADLELSGGSPLEAARAQDLGRFLPAGSRLSARVSLLSMASAGPAAARRSRMVQLAAVDGAYPLAGALVVEGPGGLLTAAALQGRPWAFAQAELLAPLGLSLGAQVRLGTRDFVLAGLLKDEPGLGAGAFSLGPRVLIGADQAAAAGLTGFGSRASYETLVGLPDPAQGEAVAAALRQRWGLTPSHTWRGQAPSPGVVRLRTVREAQAQVRGFFDRLAD
jgi:putative ABC transport system permease protein